MTYEQPPTQSPAHPPAKSMPKRRKPGSIAIKPSHAGMLHKDLGVSPDAPIPASKLQGAKASPDPAVRRRATFAMNAKGWNHAGS